ncbi:hypothetical protein OED52_01390 [Rhodococcus sp. Z13]|uniref:Uncharacterized protein n=1 Tax=Rhodococcus sacchari TaxID=2962047 RepID=A0ACD4DGS8_9NOCA|nr:hypothetical protein [Rhodococcus sp. Z13]UYP19262.1 hypothetical protein OED52_01390 [Rhodococcus sp. Z13]
MFGRVHGRPRDLLQAGEIVGMQIGAGGHRVENHADLAFENGDVFGSSRVADVFGEHPQDPDQRDRHVHLIGADTADLVEGVLDVLLGGEQPGTYRYPALVAAHGHLRHRSDEPRRIGLPRRRTTSTAVVGSLTAD